IFRAAGKREDQRVSWADTRVRLYSRVKRVWLPLVTLTIVLSRRVRGRNSALLHVPRHITVEYHPDIERAIDPLEFFRQVGVGNLDFNAKVLLPVDQNGFGEPECCCRGWFAMS